MPASAVCLISLSLLLVFLVVPALAAGAESGFDALDAQQTTAGQSTSTQQQPPAQQQQPKPQQPKPAQPQQQNPFENVPEVPQKPAPKNPAGVQEAAPATVGPNIIEAVEFRGQHKVPQDTLRALIYTKKGDVYDEESIHRDFIALWNTGRFDDLRVETEPGPNGGIILRFVVTERRTVHTIDYTGNKSISKSEILDRFKDRHVNLTPESTFDPGKVQAAKNVLQ
ncbi:MAG: hypothetical protein JO270_00035, partial [Acidobacteriaceae bacterium]|nr:hypothetical protein [Acidobacteriaceae bacterium]